MPTRPVPKKFLVAFSLAGEQRDLVRAIAEAVEDELGFGTVFLDEWFQHYIAGHDADLKLSEIYERKCELAVLCVSSQYGEKLWTQAEHRAIRARFLRCSEATDKRESYGVLPIRVGDGEVEGILINAIVPDARRQAPKEMSQLIIDRLRLVIPPPPPPPSSVKIDIADITKYAPRELIGREAEIKLLDEEWGKATRDETQRAHVLIFVALGGEGKTSLVAKWAAKLASLNWQGCNAAFAASFYSQGTRNYALATSDPFLKKALTFFGDEKLAGSEQDASSKAKRLGELVSIEPSLLILDGLEPLQYDPMTDGRGRLKDQAIADLLKALAENKNRSLCVVTTRYSIADLDGFVRATVREHKLRPLSKANGVKLLKWLGVNNGTRKEFEALVEDAKRHALTLTLLGSYLFKAHGGNIRKRDLVKLDQVASVHQRGHAFHVMDAYVRWFEMSVEGRRALAFLRLLGLFDRPASVDCLDALRSEPPVTDLTEPLVRMDDSERNELLTDLELSYLITVNRHANGNLQSVDAHPLVREYFAAQLRDKRPSAWSTAHKRLYEHLRKANEGDNPTLEDLQPVYQAVGHACNAGLYGEALDVYKTRLARFDEERTAMATGWHYSTRVHGAWSQTLACLNGFFRKPWSDPLVTEDDSEFVLQQTGWMLRSVGRFDEAEEVLQYAIRIAEENSHRSRAGLAARNLNQLYEVCGELDKARAVGQKSVELAKSAKDDSELLKNLTRLAGTLHTRGDVAQALKLFDEAWTISRDLVATDWDSLSVSYQNFLYCDLLLSQGDEQKAEEHARKALKAAAGQPFWAPISKACPNLILGEIALQRPGFRDGVKAALEYFNEAAKELSKNGEIYQIPRGLLARAKAHRALGHFEEARNDLKNVDGIIEFLAKPRVLWKADLLLESARLFLDVADRARESNWDPSIAADFIHKFRPTGRQKGRPDAIRSVRKNLREAADLLDRTHYWRRYPELHLLRARVALREGDRTEARHHVDAAREWIMPLDEGGKGFVCHKPEWEGLRDQLATH